MNLKYGEKVKARDGGYIDKEIFDPVIDAAEESIEVITDSPYKQGLLLLSEKIVSRQK